MNISRRFFMLGTAVAFTTAALNKAGADILFRDDTVSIQPVLFANQEFKKREIFLIVFTNDIPNEKHDDTLVKFMIRRGVNGPPLIECSVHKKSSYRCEMVPGYQLIFRDSEPMFVEFEGYAGSVIFYGKDDGRFFSEAYRFPSKQVTRHFHSWEAGAFDALHLDMEE